jgi:putative tryptophan/tyrosine transport system substrate-binding protein
LNDGYARAYGQSGSAVFARRQAIKLYCMTFIDTNRFVCRVIVTSHVLLCSALLFHKTVHPLVALSSLAYTAELSIHSPKRHVVVLTTGESARVHDPLLIGLRKGLKDSGYMEGENLTLSVSPNNSYAELIEDIRRYENQNVSVFVTIGATDTEIVKTMITTKPVVFMPTRNPLGRGLVKSMHRSGTNLTGLSYEGDVEVEGKQLEIFKEVVPQLKHIALIYEGTHGKPIFSSSVDPLYRTSKRLRIAITEMALKTHSEIQERIVGLPHTRDSGVYTICTNFFTRDNATPSIAKRRRIPFYGCPTQVRKFGGLLSYAPNFDFLGRRGAWYVDQILKGVKPHDMPVETPRQFELIINLKTATDIGLKIPPSLLQRADQIIE